MLSGRLFNLQSMIDACLRENIIPTTSILKSMSNIAAQAREDAQHLEACIIPPTSRLTAEHFADGKVMLFQRGEPS